VRINVNNFESLDGCGVLSTRRDCIGGERLGRAEKPKEEENLLRQNAATAHGSFLFSRQLCSLH
jgi:hypothetical protein